MPEKRVDNYLSDVLNEVYDRLDKRPSTAVEESLLEMVKNYGKYLLVALIGLLPTIFGSALEFGVISGFLIGIPVALVAIIVYYNSRQSRNALRRFEKQYSKDMLQLAKANVKAVEILNHDWQQSVEQLTKSLEESFKDTIEAYQREINDLVLLTLKEKERLLTFYEKITVTDDDDDEDDLFVGEVL